MKINDQVSLTHPAQTTYIPIVSSATQECAKAIGFTGAESQRICLALEEAVLNAIEFGYGGPQDTLTIALSRTSLGLQIVLHSRGLPLEMEELPKYDPQRAKEHQDITGLGMLVIQEMMDRVSSALLENGLRELRLLKLLPETPVGEQADQIEKPAAPSQPQSVPLNYTVRLTKPEEAETISRLALEAHGSVMFREHIYYPNRVKQMIEAGEIISAVAVTGDDEVIGHVASVPPYPGARVEELTYAFVNGRYRSQGCASDISQFLIDNAVERGVYALQALAVTNHVFSQRATLRERFFECGLLLATSPASRHWREEDQDKPGRIGNLVFVRYIQSVEETPLYAPPRHKTMIERIYRNMGNPLRLLDAPEAPELDEKSEIHTTTDFKEGWCLIDVQHYGADADLQVLAQLHRAWAQSIPAIQLMLPLTHPAAPFMTEQFEAMGFFFAGVCAGSDYGEKLLLQSIYDVDPGYDSIQVYSDFGREIKEYVQACDPTRR
ncbi:MAG: ATP-binding protein [Candidatus Competibacteraceae bacterium]|nr:ATP-binding protein [Candidatus Competibacteraceae bacterium]